MYTASAAHYDLLCGSFKDFAAGKGSVTLAFRPDARLVEWMYHCHILEHHAAGMMGHFEVVV